MISKTISQESWEAAIIACGGFEKHNRIMENLARCGHSYKILGENVKKASDLDFRITNFVQTGHYQSWLRRIFRWPRPKPILAIYRNAKCLLAELLSRETEKCGEY